MIQFQSYYEREALERFLFADGKGLQQKDDSLDALLTTRMLHDLKSLVYQDFLSLWWYQSGVGDALNWALNTCAAHGRMGLLERIVKLQHVQLAPIQEITQVRFVPKEQQEPLVVDQSGFTLGPTRLYCLGANMKLSYVRGMLIEQPSLLISNGKTYSMQEVLQGNIRLANRYGYYSDRERAYLNQVHADRPSGANLCFQARLGQAVKVTI